MRKYLNFIMISTMLIALGITGCYEQEVVDPISPGGVGYATATYTTDFTGSELNEGDTIYYTITQDKQLDVSISYTAKIIGGTATEDDFTISGGVVQPYSNEAVIMIVVNVDYAADFDETVTFEIGAHGVGTRYMLVNTTNATLDLTLRNFVSDVIEISFAWEKDVFVNAGYEDFPDYGWEESTCSYYDYDLEVYSDAGAYLGGSYSDCPEEIFLKGLPDGLYHVEALLWENWYITDFPDNDVDNVPIPATVTMTRQGAFSIVVEQDAADVLTSETLGYYDSNVGYTGEYPFIYPVDFSITDGVYTILAPDGTDLGGGKATDREYRTQRKQ